LCECAANNGLTETALVNDNLWRVLVGKVALHRLWLVLGWVTIILQVRHLGMQEAEVTICRKSFI